jgi:hypothetical protein
MAVAVLGGGDTGNTGKQTGAADDERHAAGGDKPPRHAGTNLRDVGRLLGVLFAAKPSVPATRQIADCRRTGWCVAVMCNRSGCRGADRRFGADLNSHEKPP